LLVATHNVNSGRYIYILLQGWEQSEAALICTKADWESDIHSCVFLMDTNTVGQNLLDLTSELATLHRQTTYPAKFLPVSTT
jgi:hypothetical protein